MLNDSLVAFNIYNKQTNKLLNKTRFMPVLYYWNGDNDLLFEMINSDKFIKNYLNNIYDEDTLNKIAISYFYFNYDDNQEEKYTENTILVKDYVNFENLNKNVLLDIIYNRLKTLYKICMYEEFSRNIEISLSDNISNIYNIIKDKYKERVSKETIGNWIRSELSKNKIYNSKNISLIINLFKEII